MKIASRYTTSYHRWEYQGEDGPFNYRFMPQSEVYYGEIERMPRDPRRFYRASDLSLDDYADEDSDGIKTREHSENIRKIPGARCAQLRK